MSLDREFLPAAELVKLGASIVPYDRTLNFDDVRGEIYQPQALQQQAGVLLRQEHYPQVTR